MDLLAAWLLYPLALTLIALGLGLLLDRAGGWRIPGILLLPVGFAALVAVTRLIVSESSLADLALPAILALALGGLVLGHARLRELRPDPWMTAAVLGVFCAYAAPVVMSGDPTFAGYLALPDTSHQLSLADLFATRGPDWQGLAESSKRLSMFQYVDTQYPVGGQAVLGVTRPLGLQDLAWLYQPLLAVMAAMLALGLGGLARLVVEGRRRAALAVFVGAQPALFYGYAMQGNVKEVLVAAMVVTLVSVGAALAADRAPGRALLSIGVIAAAAVAALGPAAFAYLGVAGLGLAVTWIPRRWPERDLVRDGAWIAGGLALSVVLASPILRNLQKAVEVSGAALDAPKATEDFGNLAGPIELYQAVGPYLSGDFRYGPQDSELVNSIFIAVAAVAAVVGLVWLVRRRHVTVMLLPVGMAVTTAYLLQRGSPYADGKVLTIVSPAIAFTGMLGATALWTDRWRVLGGTACAVLLAATLWSTGLAYHDVSLAPHDRYAELLDINDELDGQGPTLLVEYDEFGKYFLRDAQPFNQPEFPLSYREAPYHPDALNDRERKPSMKTPQDPDDFQLGWLEGIPYMVVRNSPYRSRPPANFQRVRAGRFYEVWRRTASPRVLAHQVQGGLSTEPSAVVSERAARRIGALAQRRGGRLAFVRREGLITLRPALMAFSTGWNPYSNYPGGLVTKGPGRLESAVTIPRAGTYRVWAEGSFNDRRGKLYLDSRVVGRIPSHAGLNNPGASEPLADVTLGQGLYRLEYVQGGGTLRPGNGGYRSSLRHIGPITFQPIGDTRLRVEQLPAARWRELVGQRLDWIEVVK